MVLAMYPCVCPVTCGLCRACVIGRFMIAGPTFGLPPSLPPPPPLRPECRLAASGAAAAAAAASVCTVKDGGGAPLPLEEGADRLRDTAIKGVMPRATILDADALVVGRAAAALPSWAAQPLALEALALVLQLFGHGAGGARARVSAGAHVSLSGLRCSCCSQTCHS